MSNMFVDIIKVFIS